VSVGSGRGAAFVSRRQGVMSQLDADGKRYIPELEVLKEWVTISLLALGAVILPVSGAYVLFLLTSW
jgi:hypothetical protein